MSDAPARFSVSLGAGGPGYEAPADRPILQSAREAGLVLASSCRNGTCRACLCRLASGRVRYVIDWPGLSAEEKAEGCILPCVAVPQSPLVIEGARFTDLRTPD